MLDKRLIPDFQCEKCKAITSHKIIKEDIAVKDKVAEIEDIPVYICPKCGEIYYPDFVVKKLAELRRELEEKFG